LPEAGPQTGGCPVPSGLTWCQAQPLNSAKVDGDNWFDCIACSYIHSRKHKTIICCYTCVRILHTGTCIVHVHHMIKKHPTTRESISLKWYPAMCPLSHPLIGNFTLNLEVFHKFHKL
jgi:hypothetical protein